MVGVLSAAVVGLLVLVAPSSSAGLASAEPFASWGQDAWAALANRECLTAQGLVGRATEAGDPIGFAVRAEMYETGRCAPHRPAQAAKDYGEAARRDHVVGHARLGYRVLNGTGVPKDRAGAKLLFRQAALGLVAMSPDRRRWFVKQLMAEGSVPAELEGALSWLEEIEKGGPEALYEAALHLKHGGDGWPRRDAVARGWLRAAALAGLTQARFELALWLLAGPTSAEDVQQGLSALHRSAFEGYPPSLRCGSAWNVDPLSRGIGVQIRPRPPVVGRPPVGVPGRVGGG